ncbi:MAG: 2-phosphosulfolactate phosphatase [Parachlamydiales bacterium]|jgi:2-phosphosulfolactate phosphatase
MLIENRKIPKINILRRDQSCDATGVVVVIDVLRAFTTAAYAFASGADKVIIVSKVDEAKSLAKAIPDALTMGEEGGRYIPGFTFDNSPWSFFGVDLHGKILIQRTSSGTQGVLLCAHAEKILVSSFVVAEATIARLHALEPAEVTLLVTGTQDGSEDLSLAEYIQARLENQYQGHMGPYLKKVTNSPAGMHARAPHGDYPMSDLDAALAVDAFPFAMEILRESGLLVLQPIKPNGSLWR